MNIKFIKGFFIILNPINEYIDMKCYNKNIIINIKMLYLKYDLNLYTIYILRYNFNTNEYFYKF